MDALAWNDSTSPWHMNEVMLLAGDSRRTGGLATPVSGRAGTTAEQCPKQLRGESLRESRDERSKYL
jgi:hypothetical protein